MPLGKVRPGKRSSSSTSYVSTVTVVVFIAFSVLGLWMLTSSSMISSQTTRTTNAFTSSTNSHHAKSIRRQDPPAFDDNPGDLPDDAIKGDTEDNKSDELKQPVETTNEETTTTTTTEVEPDEKQESEQENNAESMMDGSTSTTNEEQEKERSSVVEKNSESQERNESIEEEQQQQKQETLVTEENNKNQQNQQVEETQQRKDEESNVNQDESQQQTSGQASGEDQQQQTQQEKSEITSDETQQQRSQPDIQEITSEENKQQEESQQVQLQTSSSSEDHQQQTQEETSEITSGETQQQQGSQKAQTNEEQQSQGTDESIPVKNQESQESAKESGSNQETQQETTTEKKITEANSGDVFLGGAQSGIPKESNEKNGAWSTQADQSENQKERRKELDGSMYGYTWELCNVTAGADYIPCLDNEKALKQLHTTGHYEHRERHCPEEGPTCLVPLPQGYKQSLDWPKSRDKVWYHNVPHTLLAEVKGHQNWVKVTGEFLTFPGGGTQFIHGALHYIDFIQQAVPDIAWGKRTRVILDVGCGVASFGGYLFERDVLTMSFAPKDEHEAQVQFALERGIPAISAVMGSKRLPFPSRVFDLVHCARCRVPWHVEGGALLLELNRVLRPGGYFVWSATPVYQKLEEDVEIWNAMSSLTKSMCWDLITIKKDKMNSVGAAIYRKPTSNECYDQRKHNSPPMCKRDDDPNAAWYVSLQACMHRAPVDENERGSQWPENWPLRVQKPPYWLNSSRKGIYGRPAPDDFATDYEHWKRTVTKLYMSGLGISWSNVRNVMDMRAVYGGFAAALKDLNVWVLNVVNVDSADTLPIIYERGLFGIYHDWCESFSTYPRTYDLLHADHLFSRLKKRCKIEPVMAEVDRMVRPGGKLIVRDESSIVGEIENILKSLHWEVHLTFSKDREGILSAQKSDWRPHSYSASS